jgi:hypothetical protein
MEVDKQTLFSSHLRNQASRAISKRNADTWMQHLYFLIGLIDELP